MSASLSRGGAAILLVLLTLGGCAPVAPAAPPAEPSPRGRWDASRPAGYAYAIEVSCFCIHRGTYAVEVGRDGAVSIRDAATGAATPRDRAAWIPTVEALFDAIGRAAAEGTPVRARYHAELGFPEEVEIGRLADDSGTLYRITSLRPL
jgi:hypothetical protein